MLKKIKWRICIMKKYYTGVGSRETPKEILKLMENLSKKLAKLGYILRSGGANGADFAFENGCDKAKGKKEIYIPWNGFNNRNSINEKGVILATNLNKYKNAEDIAFRIHPKFQYLYHGAKLLHTRNVFQVLGKRLNKKRKSEFVICYTKNGKAIGGTATAIYLAKYNMIPVYNLAIADDAANLILKISEIKRK